MDRYEVSNLRVTALGRSEPSIVEISTANGVARPGRLTWARNTSIE